MLKIKSEAELFSHLKRMRVEEPVSTIIIPGVGRFKILVEENEESIKEMKIREQNSVSITGEEFIEWKEVLEKLELEVSSAAFATWLKGTKAVQLNNQHICIICHNSFQLDWVKKHYYSYILSLVEEVTGMEYFIEFHVNQGDKQVMKSQGTNYC